MSKESAPKAGAEKVAEKLKISPETKKGLKNKAEKLKNKAEKAEKLSTKEARGKVHEAIKGAEKKSVQKHESAPKKGEKKSRKATFVSVDDKKKTYKKTMSSIQSKMPAPTRRFSKVIHNPVVDKVSETAGKTVARPSGVLGGGLAVVLGLGVSYFTAKNAGFELSGSEFIWLLLIGFVLGLIAEWVIRGVRSAAKN